jgi:hypothetical protein
MDIDTLKAKYPDKADKIKSGMPETENLDWRTSLQNIKQAQCFMNYFIDILNLWKREHILLLQKM